MPATMTPAAWLKVLEARLDEQAKASKLYERYYNGEHRLRFATEKFREVFGGLFGTFSDNWCGIIVDAPVERLEVTGFRFGDDSQSDADAWDIWQQNNLDAESVITHTEAGKNGACYVLVDGSEAAREENGGQPRITAEHPSQCVVAHAPGDRRQRLAALKRWRDDDGYAYANLYLPERVHKFRSADKVREITEHSRIQWTARRDDAGGRNSLGVVSIVPVYNNPGLMAGGRSDLLLAIPMQDAINKQVLDMMVTSEFQAFRQRVLIGVDLPRGPDGQVLPQAEVKALVSRIWSFKQHDAKVQELGESNLQNYVRPIEMLIQHLAAQTRTPPHYLLSSIVNASGDALKAAEAGLVSKVRKKQLDFSEAWEEVMRLAFKAKGDTERASEMRAHTLWADPEMKTEGEKVDAAVKLRTLGVPLEMCWERVGFSQEEIRRMVDMAGLPKRPPPGATTAAVPSVNGDGRDSGATAGTTPTGGQS
jgi:hypothetical protein